MEQKQSNVMTDQEIRAVYVENCKRDKTWDFAPIKCRQCGCEVIRHHASRILAGSSDITGCPKCYRSFCD